MRKADEVHVIWNTTSEGRLFDLGMIFAINEFLAPFGFRKPVRIVNVQEFENIGAEQYRNGINKSYERVLRNLSNGR